MPAVNLSPLFNAQQLFTTAGVPLSGGFINTYLAGTATPALTYTDSAGTIANSNPIQLDAAGLVPFEIWLIDATAYKYIVTDSLGANPRSYDNITAPRAGGGAVTSYTTITDTGGYNAQLLTGGGFAGYRHSDQVAARKAEYLYWGSASTPTYGMTAGYAGVNTAAGVGYTIGTGDGVRMTFDPAGNGVGIGLAPTAGQGVLQLLGFATGGIKLGNFNNTYGNALDWYEESTFTPVVNGLGSPAYVTQTGEFQRVGNKVKFRLTLVWTAGTNAASITSVGGLPYASTAAIQPVTLLINLINVGLTWLAGSNVAMAYLNGSALIQCVGVPVGGAASAVSLLNLNAGTKDLYIAGEYFV